MIETRVTQSSLHPGRHLVRWAILLLYLLLSPVRLLTITLLVMGKFVLNWSHCCPNSNCSVQRCSRVQLIESSLAWKLHGVRFLTLTFQFYGLKYISMLPTFNADVVLDHSIGPMRSWWRIHSFQLSATTRSTFQYWNCCHEILLQVSKDPMWNKMYIIWLFASNPPPQKLCLSSWAGEDWKGH